MDIQFFAYTQPLPQKPLDPQGPYDPSTLPSRQDLRKAFADRLRSIRASHSRIMYINPSDKFYRRFVYLCWIDTGTYWALPFLVHADHAGEAHDEIADYCMDNHLRHLFPDQEDIDELIHDATAQGHQEEAFLEEQFSRAGNCGLWFANMLAVEGEITEPFRSPLSQSRRKK